MEVSEGISTIGIGKFTILNSHFSTVFPAPTEFPTVVIFSLVTILGDYNESYNWRVKKKSEPGAIATGFFQSRD